jgi:hypothetical protein
MRYWTWFFCGIEGGPAGYWRFLDRWLIFHLLAGAGLAWAVPITLSEAANAVLLPLASIFIGLSFAWGGNASALLQTSEILKLSKHVDGGLSTYVYVYSTAIVTLLAAATVWGIAGLKVFDDTWPGRDSHWYPALAGLAYAISSLALRECWHVVLGAQYLLLSRARVQEIEEEASQERTQDRESDIRS